MKDGKLFRFIMILLFIIFITLYISQATGYYDYQQHKKVELTAEKMKQFEQDVKDGKNIDIKNYLESTTKNYQNGMSRFGLKVSSAVKGFFKKGIGEVFNVFERWLSSE